MHMIKVKSSHQHLWQYYIFLIVAGYFETWEVGNLWLCFRIKQAERVQKYKTYHSTDYSGISIVRKRNHKPVQDQIKEVKERTD
jgi:hypothetical protein